MIRNAGWILVEHLKMVTPRGTYKKMWKTNGEMERKWRSLYKWWTFYVYCGIHQSSTCVCVCAPVYVFMYIYIYIRTYLSTYLLYTYVYIYIYCILYTYIWYHDYIYSLECWNMLNPGWLRPNVQSWHGIVNEKTARWQNKPLPCFCSISIAPVCS